MTWFSRAKLIRMRISQSFCFLYLTDILFYEGFYVFRNIFSFSPGSGWEELYNNQFLWRLIIFIFQHLLWYRNFSTESELKFFFAEREFFYLQSSRAQILHKATEHIQYMRRKNHSHQVGLIDSKGRAFSILLKSWEGTKKISLNCSLK